MKWLVRCALVVVLFVPGCSIDSRLRDRVAATEPQFELYVETSAPREDLTPTERARRRELEDALRDFFAEARRVR